MEGQDPVLIALSELKSAAPEKLVALIEGYEQHGIDGIDLSWKQLIEDTLHED